MSEFWWGVLALPLIIAALGAAAAIIFGAWMLAEKWSEVRWKKLKPVEMPREIGKGLWTQGNAGMRASLASMILAGLTVHAFRFGSSGLIYISGRNKDANARKINDALHQALINVAKKETSHDH